MAPPSSPDHRPFDQGQTMWFVHLPLPTSGIFASTLTSSRNRVTQHCPDPHPAGPRSSGRPHRASPDVPAPTPRALRLTGPQKWEGAGREQLDLTP